MADSRPTDHAQDLVTAGLKRIYLITLLFITVWTGAAGILLVSLFQFNRQGVISVPTLTNYLLGLVSLWVLGLLGFGLGLTRLRNFAFEGARHQAAMIESEARYRSLFEDSPISLWVEDFSEVKKGIDALRAQGVTDFRAYFSEHPQRVSEYLAMVRITDINRATLSLYQADSKQALMVQLDRIMPPTEHSHFIEELALISEGRTEFEWIGKNLTLQGNPMDVSLRWSVVPGYENTFSKVLVSVEDITQRKRAEHALQQSEQRFSVFMDYLPAAVFMKNSEGQTLFANRFLSELLDWKDWSGKTTNELLPEEIAQQMIRDDAAALEGGHIIRQEKLVDVNGVEHTFETHKFPIPVPNGPPLLGGIAVDVSDNLRAQEQTQKLAGKLKAIAGVAHQIAGLIDPERLAQATVESLQNALQLYNTNLFLMRNDQLIYITGFGGETRPPPGMPVRMGQGLIGLAAQTRQAILSNDTSNDPRYVIWDFLPETRSELAIPVLSGDEVLGVLDVQSMDKNTFDVTDIEALGILADQLAISLDNARLYSETRQQMQRLAALRAMDMAISSSFDLRVTLSVLLDQVTSQLGVDAVCVLLYNPYDRILESAATRGFLNSNVNQLRLRLDHSYAGRAALERQIIHVPNIKDAVIHDEPQFANLAGDGFVEFFAVPLITKGQVKGVVETFHRQPLNPDEEWLNFLDTLAGDIAIAIDNAAMFNDLQRSNVELTLAYDTTLEGWSRALELRDQETEGHAHRVTDMTMRLARVMGIPDQELVHVRRGALLHDIGKMAVPDQILHKPGPLDESEWDIMRRHPKYAVQLLSPILYLKPALEIPQYHHEKWDGSGYPHGLSGQQIPLPARVFAVIDVWDALLSERPYRPAWTQKDVLEYIRDQAGKHFDPEVVEKFLSLLRQDEML